MMADRRMFSVRAPVVVRGNAFPGPKLSPRPGWPTLRVADLVRSGLTLRPGRSVPSLGVPSAGLSPSPSAS
jgi:hypothetical protein